jgi:8-amino-3,8-dideoxy-alpha-D-manno-octulosonate transaminase
MPGYEIINSKEKNAVIKLFDSLKYGIKPIFYNSKKVLEFEKNFAQVVGSKYAVAVSSGTAAIKTSFIAAGVKPGDEIITQAFTFIAVVEAIMDIGAIPIIAEINETLNMCPIDLQKKITKKTKVIMPVHMLGVSAEVDKIKEIAKKKNIIVIDDNCEAFGAKWDKQMLGRQFDACAWSFDNGKTITTGEGGMVTTDNEEFHKLCREYRDHGHENNINFPRGKDTHRIPGFNFRTTELNAVIGIEQLKKVPIILKNNKKNYIKFFKSIKKYKIIKFRKIPKKCTPLYDCLIFSFKDNLLADRFAAAMKMQGLNTKNLPDAMEWHCVSYWDHIFKNYGYDKKKLKNFFKKSTDLLKRSVAIPILIKETKNSLNLRIAKIKKILNEIE